MKIEIDGKLLRVHRRHPTWDDASRVIAFERMNPPDGYRVVQAVVRPRTGTDGRAMSGRRCNTEIQYEHCIRSVEPFTLDEAYEFFRSESEGPPEHGSASLER